MWWKALLYISYIGIVLCQQSYSGWVPIKTHNTPPPRYDHTTVLLGNTMVIFGGTTSHGESNDLWALDLPDRHSLGDRNGASLTWKQLCDGRSCGDGIYKRTAHSAVLYDDTLYVFGGRSGSDASMNDLWSFNFSHRRTMEWTMICSSLQYLLWGQCSSPPPVRYGHSAVMLGSKMVIFGGNTGSHERASNDVWYIDLSASDLQWIQLCTNDKSTCGSPPSPRAFHSAAMMRSQMIIFGGGPWMSNDLWKLDLRDLRHPQWIQIPSTGYSPSNRANEAAALVLNSAIAVVGGKTLTGYVNDVWVISLRRNASQHFAHGKWVLYCEGGEGACGQAPSPRSGHSLVTVGKSTILLYGGHSGDQLFGDLWALPIIDTTTSPVQPVPHLPVVPFVPRTVFLGGALVGAALAMIFGWWYYHRSKRTIIMVAPYLEPAASEQMPLLPEKRNE